MEARARCEQAPTRTLPRMGQPSSRRLTCQVMRGRPGEGRRRSPAAILVGRSVEEVDPRHYRLGRVRTSPPHHRGSAACPAGGRAVTTRSSPALVARLSLHRRSRHGEPPRVGGGKAALSSAQHREDAAHLRWRRDACAVSRASPWRQSVPQRQRGGVRSMASRVPIPRRCAVWRVRARASDFHRRSQVDGPAAHGPLLGRRQVSKPLSVPGCGRRRPSR